MPGLGPGYIGTDGFGIGVGFGFGLRGRGSQAARPRQGCPYGKNLDSQGSFERSE